MQHNKGAIEDDREIIRRDVEKWWKTIDKWYKICKNKRGANRDEAWDDLEDGIKKAIRTVKRNAAKEVNEAREECRVHEHEHPLYHKVERLENNHLQATDFLREYKRELKKHVDLKEFEKIRDRIEGRFDLLHEIQRCRDELMYAVQAIREKHNREAYDAPLEDEKDPEDDSSAPENAD